MKDFISSALDIPVEDISIEVPTNEAHGHYSTNIAMRFAKERKMSPMELAEEFVLKLRKYNEEQSKPCDDPSCPDWTEFSKIEAVAPGFINFTLSDKYLQEASKRPFSEEDSLSKEDGTVIFEYSDPNIAKPMHVGHLRGTIIGDALANIYEYLGYKVVRWNYIGDWGTQFGKLIAAYKKWGDDKVIEKDPIEELVALYIRFHKELETNPELADEGRAEFKKLEDGDSESTKLWEWFREVSLKKFEEMYSQLDVSFEITKGEAFYAKEMERVILSIREGIGKESEGALIVEFDDLPPALIQKQDGASLYITRDIAQIEYREKEYSPEKILYVVGNEQALHFSQLFAISSKLGLTKAELTHIKYGLVLGEDGKKLSTRDGKTIKLQELIDTLTEKAFVAVTEKSPDLSEEERRQISKDVAVGALKYNDLKENRVSDIVFNWDEMLNFSGNSAPYLQYTVARLGRLLEKAGEISGADVSTLEADELSLSKKTFDFDDVVLLCKETNVTSHLATYAFQLAKKVNAYYESTRVLDDSDEGRRNARLTVLLSCRNALRKSLSLLGIPTPERI